MFIGTYVETLPPQKGEMFSKILFCDIEEIAPIIQKIGEHELEDLIDQGQLTPNHTSPSGLDDRIGKDRPGRKVDDNCILLSPFDFIIRASMDLIDHKVLINERIQRDELRKNMPLMSLLDTMREDAVNNVREGMKKNLGKSRCTISGGKRNKTKRRKLNKQNKSMPLGSHKR